MKLSLNFLLLYVHKHSYIMVRSPILNIFQHWVSVIHVLISTGSSGVDLTTAHTPLLSPN